MTTIARIKYIVTGDLPKGDNIEASETTAADRETLVNVNCPIRIVLDYIRKVAQLSDTCEFDLCDETNCQLKNVSFYKPNTRGMDILQPNLTYFIVTFQRDEKGRMINLTPLLTAKTAKIYCDIMTKTRRPSQKGSSIESILKNNNNSNKSNE